MLVEALSQFEVWIINVIGIFGIFLIIYSIVVKYTGSQWDILDKIADKINTYLTLIGTFLTAISIYFPVNMRKPDALSLFISAPIVIISVLIALIGSTLGLLTLPAQTINGFALLAIAGALFRLLSR